MTVPVHHAVCNDKIIFLLSALFSIVSSKRTSSRKLPVTAFAYYENTIYMIFNHFLIICRSSDK